MSFFDDASLAFLPSGGAGKDGKAYSIKPTDGTGDFTFSRGSNLSATRIGPTGLIEKGRENLLKYSNDFTQSIWTKVNGASVSSTQVADPFGGTNAWELTFAISDDSRIQQQVTTSSGTVYAYSFWARVESGTKDIRFAGVTGNLITKTLTTTWQRFENFEVETDTLAFPQIRKDNAEGSYTIQIYAAQLEVGLAATDYIESGASTGKAGLLENEPRFDYSGGATCPSLLLEPSRTNLVGYSEYLEEADQTPDSQILTTTDTTPEGTNNARVLAYNGGTNQHYMAFVPSVTNGETYTFSVFLKKKELRYVALVFLNGYAGRFFDLETGTILGTTGGTLVDSKIEDYGNGWYRCSITDVATSTTKFSGIYLSDNGTALGPFVPTGNDGVYVYGYQVEAGSYPTSYIPNHSGGSATRTAEAAVKTLGASYFPTSGVSAFIDFDVTHSSVTNLADLYRLSGSSTELRLETRTNGNIYIQQANMVISGDNFNSVNLCPSTAKKICFTFSPTQVKAYVDGVLIKNFNGSYTWGFTDLNMEMEGSTAAYNNTMLFPSVLSDQEAITLTTL